MIISSQHALHMAYGEYILKLNAILCVSEWREISVMFDIWKSFCYIVQKSRAYGYGAYDYG